MLETKKNRICSGRELVANKTITVMLEAAAEVVKRKTIDHTRQEIVKNATTGTTCSVTSNGALPETRDVIPDQASVNQ